MNTHKHIKRILNNKHLISFGDSDDDNEGVTHIGQTQSNSSNDQHEHIHELKEINNNDKDENNNDSVDNSDNDEDDESVSLSENDEIVRNAKANSGVICNEKKQNNVISNNKNNNNTQITLLTNEIHNIKNNINTTSQSLFKDHQNNNSILDHYNKKYLHLKRNRNNTTITTTPKPSSQGSLPSKIIAFHNHLLTAKSNASSKHSWLTSKLKFHIDSEKAYSISKLHN
jgi:hypothetical protein